MCYGYNLSKIKELSCKPEGLRQVLWLVHCNSKLHDINWHFAWETIPIDAEWLFAHSNITRYLLTNAHLESEVFDFGFGHTKSCYQPVKSCIKMSVVSVTHKWSGLAGLAAHSSLTAPSTGPLSSAQAGPGSPLSGFPSAVSSGQGGGPGLLSWLGPRLQDLKDGVRIRKDDFGTEITDCKLVIHYKKRILVLS